MRRLYYIFKQQRNFNADSDLIDMLSPLWRKPDDCFQAVKKCWLFSLLEQSDTVKHKDFSITATISDDKL